MKRKLSNIKLIRLFMIVCCIVLLAEVHAQNNKFTISGFSELGYKGSFGKVANEDDLEKYEAAGGEDELIERTNRVLFPGFNLIFTSQINDRLKFQGEINNSFEELEDKSLEIELLRGYIDYKINDKFNIQAGKFLSSFGYLNRNQRFYGYLNYSVEHRDLVEKELGFVPLTTVGIKAYGSLPIGNTSSLNYHVSVGGMREVVPEGSEFISSFEWGEDESNSPGGSALLEYLTYMGETEVLVGFSGYRVGRIVGFYVEDGEDVPFGEEADELEEEGLLDREEMELSETGFAAHLRLDNPKFQFIGEYHQTSFNDEIGNLEQSVYNYHGYSLELAFKSKLAKKSFYPYLRFDGRKADEGHPYYGLELEEEELEKSFTPSWNEIIVGFAWDVVPSNRIKVEYGRYTTGPFPSSNIKISTAFAF